MHDERFSIGGNGLGQHGGSTVYARIMRSKGRETLVMLCKYCYSVQHVQLIGCGDQRAGTDSAPEYYRIVSDQVAVPPLARVKGYVWR